MSLCHADVRVESHESREAEAWVAFQALQELEAVLSASLCCRCSAELRDADVTVCEDCAKTVPAVERFTGKNDLVDAVADRLDW